MEEYDDEDEDGEDMSFKSGNSWRVVGPTSATLGKCCMFCGGRQGSNVTFCFCLLTASGVATLRVFTLRTALRTGRNFFVLVGGVTGTG
jgi:hypothetical protein